MYKFYTRLWCRPPGYAKQFLRVMKILLVLMTTLLMQVSASTFAQKITLNEKQASLVSILEKINKQSGVDFLINNELLAKAKPVTIHVNNEELAIVLDKIFEGQPLEYTIMDKAVAVTKKAPTFLERLADRWAAIDVHGRVVDQEGKPLPGATVKVKGTGKSVSTNGKGEFYLEKVEEDVVLVISFIGYVSKEVSAGKDMGDVVLELSDSKLDEVQVIAYGETTRRLSTGNIFTVKAEDIAKQPVNNLLLALQGRVPGIQIAQANGFSGGGIQILIQGQNSLQNGNDPFFVIDGVPYVSQLLPNLGDILKVSQSAGIGEQNNGNPLSFINPNDIESIEVLKDADATSIYGSRAANGAILITTKKGKVGQTKFDLNIQHGFGNVTRKLDLLNTQQYLVLRKEAFLNDGVSVPNTSSDPNGTNWDLTVWDQYRYTDWQKVLIGNTAYYNDGQLSISGGNTNTQFLAGGGYHRETTVLPGDFSDTKGSVHFNINNNSANQRFKFTFSGSYLIDNNKLPATDLTESAMNLAPNAPEIYNSDGSLNWAQVNGTSSWNNPLSLLEQKYQIKTTNLISSASLSYQIINGLEAKSTFGYTNLQSDELRTGPLSSITPEDRTSPFVTRRASYGNNNINSWIVEPHLTYISQLGKGILSALLGTTIQQRNSNRKLFEGRGYNSDFVLDNINAATTIIVPENSTVASQYRYNALFGRLNYNWKDIYILNLTARRDGTSRFGPQNRFHNFGAIAAAWLFSNESFIKNNLPFLSFGKVKVSYGTSGNDQIGDYSYLSLYANNNPSVPYSGGSSLIPNRLTNPYLQWEETKKISIGFDGGFLNDRILINATYYRNRSSNQLLSTALPTTAGLPSIATNLPATVQNSGLELSLNCIPIKNEKIVWSANFNATIPRNKLISFKDLASSIFYASDYKIGQPISLVRITNFLGVNSSTGLYEYLDKDGNITNNPGANFDNYTVFENTAPDFYGGFQNTISYKQFSLDFLFQFVKQRGKNYFYGNGYPGSFAPINQPVTVLDRWRSEGDIVPVQKISAMDFNVLSSAYSLYNSSAVWGDASYIRLKNLSISWDLPNNWIKEVKINRARLYVQGQNLLTITNYKGLDPETKSSLSLPPLRLFTLGFQITL